MKNQALSLMPAMTKLPERKPEPAMPVVLSEDPWESASENHKQMALSRLTFITPMVDLITQGVSQKTAVESIFSKLKVALNYNQTNSLLSNALAVGTKGKLPSQPTVKRWLKDYFNEGKTGLLPQNKGRVRQTYGWEADAISLYNTTSKPSMADVAFTLRRLGFNDATATRVRNYLKSLPATLGANSPMRLGKHYYRLNKMKHVERDKSALLVGEVYQGDGHTIDCYIAHPNTGKPYRPEMTAWIDVRSMMIVGWYLSDAESSISTLLSLSVALVQHDHVPAWLHIDNGSGFRSKMMSDESVGFYKNFDITTMFSIPGNPRGKGQIEGWFRKFRDQHDKFFNGGIDYCGHDQADETNRQITVHIEQGKRQLCSLAQYVDSVKAYVEAYNNEPQKGLNNKSPAQLWATLEHVPLEIPQAAIIRPREKRIVRKQGISLHNRKYRNDELVHWLNKEVVVEYDLLNDEQVWLYTEDGRLICIAKLTHKVAYIPQSRIDEARIKRKQGQHKRLQKKADEATAQSIAPVEADSTLDALDIHSLNTQALEAEYEHVNKHDTDDDTLSALIDNYDND